MRLRTLFSGMVVVLMVVSLGIWSFGQDNIKFDEKKLADIIDSPKSKQILASKIGGYSKVIFDKSTLAFDFFSADVIVSTIDFEHIASGRHGTVSFSHKFQDGEFILLQTSYWFWGTVVSGEISVNTTWNAAGNPYYVTDSITVRGGATLTIEPGTVIRFRKFTDLEENIGISVYGALVCDGATFTTSCKLEDSDQSQLYESDWDGILENGASGFTIENSLVQFARIGIRLTSTDTGLSVSGCTLRKCDLGLHASNIFGNCLIEDNVLASCYTGMSCWYETSAVQITGNTLIGPDYGGHYGIHCSSSSPAISSNSISNFYNGIRCVESAAPGISLNTLQDNSYGIWVDCNTYILPVVTNNNIAGNYTYGLYNKGSLVAVNGENNWWGDASGPYHPTLNPGGLGDAVSDGVDFDPWLTSMVTAAVAAFRGR